MANLTEANVDVDGFTINGTSDPDNIDTSGGAVDYTINGDAGNDVIVTGDGDTVAVEGGVTVNAGAGDDTITGGAGDDNLRGEDDADTINGGAGGDTIDGGAGNDILNGDAGEDLIVGGTGDDTIDGGEDGDVIIGSAGTDTVNDTGTAGADKLQYNEADSIDILQSVTDNGGGSFTFVTDLGSTTTTGVEFLWFNGTASDPFINIDLSDPNLVLGTAGADNGTIDGDVGNGNVILAGSGNDTINTGNFENRVYAGTGDDNITTGTGNDEVDGGAGTDTVTVGYNTTDVTNYSNDGTTITITTASNVDVFRDIESFVFADKTVALAGMDTEFSSTPGSDVNGTAGDDNPLNGTASGESINGLAGNDTIVPGAGDDTVDGGDDTDTVVFSIATTDVTAYANDGTTITITSSEGTDTFTNVEAFQFSDTTVTGAANMDTAFNAVRTDNQSISGTAGADTLTGGLGDDTITPAAGDDTVDGAAGTDTAVFSIASTDVTGYSNDGTTITIVSSEGTDTFTNVEAFQFSDTTVTGAANMDTAFAAVTSTNQTFTSTSGDDTFAGGTGDDTAVFGFAAADLSALSVVNGTLTLVGTEGTDTLSAIENLQFSDQTVAVSDLVLGTTSAETVTGTANADIIAAGAGIDTINAGAGNDLIIGAELGETIDGGAGTDTVKFAFASSEITSAVRKLDGSVEVTTAQGTATLSNVENVVFASEASVTLASVVTAQNSSKPTFSLPDGNGGTIEATPEVYTGPVSYLEYQLLGDGNSNVVTASSDNDFLNLLGGDDAADGGDGDDVLDGGLGSNFLTGGNGSDVFFLDGRGASGGAITWSTITDFTSGDSVNIFGWVEGTSVLLLTQDSAGAAGFQGITHHYDLDADGSIDTSITFTGLTEVPANSAQEVAGNGYLLFA